MFHILVLNEVQVSFIVFLCHEVVIFYFFIFVNLKKTMYDVMMSYEHHELFNCFYLKFFVPSSTPLFL
jgi:hypothetical protein